MNAYGRMADVLTFMEESLETPSLAPYAPPVQKALQIAFVVACEASRAMRLDEEARAAKCERVARRTASRKSTARARS